MIGGGDINNYNGGLANDWIYGNGGDDKIYGGAGNDTIYGGLGNDTAHGNAGNDTIYGDGLTNDATQTGNDKLYGDTGDDTLNGGRGSDELHGGMGTNRLEGNQGSDKLIAEGTNDTLSGGRGNDIIELNAATATIEFGSGDGSDSVQFDLASGTYTLKLIGLNAADIEVIGGGLDVYYASTDYPGPSGTWYQFLTVRAAGGDQITFMEAGLGSTKNIGPTGTGPDGDYFPVSYNRGYYPGSPDAPSNQGQLDKIVFADGTSWDQATIWSHLAQVVDWSYGSGQAHPYGYGDYTETTFLPYVEKTYLQAFTDFAAAQNSAPSSEPDAMHASTTGRVHFDLASDLAGWP